MLVCFLIRGSLTRVAFYFLFSWLMSLLAESSGLGFGQITSICHSFLCLFDHKPYPSAIKWPKATKLTDYSEAKCFYHCQILRPAEVGMPFCFRVESCYSGKPEGRGEDMPDPSRHAGMTCMYGKE